MAEQRIHDDDQHDPAPSGPRLICAWCSPPRDLGPAPGCDGDTHGICQACAARAAAEAEGEDRSEPQPVRSALVALLRQKVRLGHVGSDAALRAVTKAPKFRREVLGEGDAR